MGMAKIVNVGVDTLVLNAFYIDERGKPYKGELVSSFRLQLDEWKRAAQEAHEECPTTLTFNSAVLHMFPNGAGQGQWPWMLKTKDITLCWLLAVSVGQMRPLRTPHDISRALLIPQSTCKIEIFTYSPSQRGNLHCAEDSHLHHTFAKLLLSVLPPPFCRLDKTIQHCSPSGNAD